MTDPKLPPLLLPAQDALDALAEAQARPKVDVAVGVHPGGEHVSMRVEVTGTEKPLSVTINYDLESVMELVKKLTEGARRIAPKIVSVPRKVIVPGSVMDKRRRPRR